MLARIEFDGAPAPDFVDINENNLVAAVSNPEVRVFGKGNSIRVLAVDCGMKHNIVRELARRGAEVRYMLSLSNIHPLILCICAPTLLSCCQVTVVPWDYKFIDVISDYHGLFLSNGPGDPTVCTKTIDELKKVIALEGDAVRPIFGICLGNQLLSLAAGATAHKLPFGNRGQNQPVRNTMTGECYITPQNHGYAIDDSSLPAGS
jgi:carbamoyl-phosphate synthase (ammonia)